MESLNSKIYCEQYIKKYFIPYIKKHYKIGEYIFLARYFLITLGKKVTDYLSSDNIQFIEKYYINVSYAPQGRWIEKFVVLGKKEYWKVKAFIKHLMDFAK